MTCIAGLVEGKTVWVGGDSAGVGGYDLCVRADAKVFRNGPFLFGFTSSFRMGDLLRDAFQPPDHDPRMEDGKYLRTAWIDAVRKCLKDGGHATAHDGQEWGGGFLLGYHGRLWVIEADYQVGEWADGFAAVGCGAQVALGSLYATKKRPPRERIRTALRAAERFSAGVRGPFKVLSV